MRTKVIIGVLAVLTLGTGFWLTWRGLQDRPPALAGPIRDAAAAVAAERASASGAADQQSGGATGQAGAGQRREVEVTQGAGDADAAFVRLTGRLVDRLARPRPDFPVKLDGWQGFAVRGSKPRATDSVTSDADGHFEFLLPKGNLYFENVEGGLSGSLRPGRDGFVFGAGAISFHGVNVDRDFGDLEVLAESRVSGFVRDRLGQPVAGVKLTADKGSFGLSAMSSSETGQDGSFVVGMLHPGEWHLRTVSGSYMPTVVVIQLGPEDHVRDLLLTVEPGRSISGQVVDDRGLPLQDVKVGCRRREERPGVMLERFTPDEAVLTDENGWFTLAGLTGDRVTVRAFSGGHAAAMQREVPVGTSNLLLQLYRHGQVEGVLRDRSGRPIAGSRVSAWPAKTKPAGGWEDMDRLFEAMPAMGWRSRGVTGADGTFRIDGVEPGSVTVHATGDNHRPARAEGVTVRPGHSSAGVVLIADRGAVAQVLVVDEVGEPVSSAQVLIRRPPKAPVSGLQVREEYVGGHGMVLDSPIAGGGLGNGTTDDDGIADIAGLPAGPVRVTCSHEDYAESRPVDVVLPAGGTTDVRLVLRSPGFVDVRVTDIDGAPIPASLVLHGPIGDRENERDRNETVGADGRVRIGPIAEGDYWVELQLVSTAQNHSAGGAMVFLGDNNRSLRSTRRRFKIVVGRAVEVVLLMPVLARVHGRVVGADQSVAGVEVELEAAPEDPATGEAGGHGSDKQSTLTDDNGDYSFSDVMAGDYQLRWGKRGQMVKASRELTISPGQRELRRDLSLSYGRLRVRAVDTDGEPVEGAAVELLTGKDRARGAETRVMVTMSMTADEGGGTTSMTMGPQKAKTDIDGIAEIDEVPAGTYLLRVSGKRYIASTIEDQLVVEGALTDSGSVELRQSGRIRGQVVDESGDAVAMVLVSARKAGANEPPKRMPALGGSYAIDSLEPGRYLVSASRLGTGGLDEQGPEIEVEVVAGKTAKARLTVPSR